MIAFNRATLTNQIGTNPDIRFMMVTFGINAAFMQMGLAYTAPAGTEPAECDTEETDLVESKPNPNFDIADKAKVSISHFEGEVTQPVTSVS